MTFDPAVLGILLFFAVLFMGLTGVAFGFWRAGKRFAWRRLRAESPLCPRCHYDLRGQTESRCPECGACFTLGELWVAQRDLDDAEQPR